jgi:hypothetical protein
MRSESDVRRPLRALFVSIGVLSGCAGVVRADPWLAPGDVGLRHDLAVLADAGILRGPITTWPISWPEVARDVLAVDPDASRPASVEQALSRVRRLARRASERGFAGWRARAAIAASPVELRAFADTPREEGEVSLGASWLGDHVALNLQATAVVDPEDERQIRADGSYIGVNIGNFMVSMGYMERWWGPGWDGSLILSTNARPIPSVTIERNYADPFETKLLSWIGPWRASIAVGEAEEHGVEVPNVRFLAARVNFKPRPWLEFGLTRTAQWCGGDRSCDLGTFRDLLIGRDNRDESLSANDEPGNQMAGYDARVRSPWKSVPLVLYTQWIGEDEAGGLPAKFLGLFGAEWWGDTPLGSARLRLEYADTTCTFTRQDPDFNCGYRNALYPQGYAYRRRVIGHALDNDSRMWSLGAVVVTARGDSFDASVRTADINRDGGRHAISSDPADINNVEFRYSRVLGSGRMILGLGFDDRTVGGVSDSETRGFLAWQQGF